MATMGQSRAFELQDQRAGVINNVARDQYNEHALRIEPMRRRARNVMRTGWALVFAGFALAAAGMALYAGSIVHFINHQGAGFSTQEHINFTGFGIAALGSIAMALGALVIIASLFMKRGVRQEERRRR